MKSCPNFGRFGGLAAVLMSLMPGADNCAQDVRAPQPSVAPPAATAAPILAACSPDGEYSAVATPDGRIKCVPIHEGARTRTLHHCNLRLLAFSPDSCFLASAGGCPGSRGKIKVWPVAEVTTVCTIETGLGEDPHMSFSPNGLLLVTTGENSRINLWELPKGTLKWSGVTDRPVSHLAISKDGKAVVAIFTDGSVQRFPEP